MIRITTKNKKTTRLVRSIVTISTAPCIYLLYTLILFSSRLNLPLHQPYDIARITFVITYWIPLCCRQWTYFFSFLIRLLPCSFSFDTTRPATGSAHCYEYYLALVDYHYFYLLLLFLLPHNITYLQRLREITTVATMI